jgi:glycosyltransferase involved in cell wall biosynthesis
MCSKNAKGEEVISMPQPLVSVVTPVYNMEKYLPECIESVLRQTYANIEYIIVNNRSTDRSLEIALRYAAQDPRIRVHSNESFVEVMVNHNVAFNLISPEAKYCKVVSADDFIFPDCIARMVEVAEANPSVGFVGSYQLSESRVRWQGFRYPRAVFTGREICRQCLLGDDPSFGFGSPTSLLYRADLIRGSKEFYPNAASSPHVDTSACFIYLQVSDFGFVYQVLSYERVHGETQTSNSIKMNLSASENLSNLIKYGRFYLDKGEFKKQLKQQLRGYHEYLAVNLFMSRGNEFWSYHKSRLYELGYPLTLPILLKALATKVLKEFMNPEQAIRKIFRIYSKKPQSSQK